MGSIGIIIVVIVVGLIILWTLRSFSQKRKLVDEEHKEKMAKIRETKKSSTELTGEAELYIGLFVIFAKDHVTNTGKKISSNRLSPLEARFREGYQTFMSRGLPEMEKPYQQIKAALKEAGLMVDTKGH